MQRLILPSSPTRSKPWGNELGFQDISIADAGTEMKQAESDLQDWLSKVCHGEMDYMAKHGTRRTVRRNSFPARMNYIPTRDGWQVIYDGNSEFISRYHWGEIATRYCGRLQKLADKINVETGHFNYRVFTNRARVMEVEWAQSSAWQAYPVAFTRSRIDVFSGRTVCRSAIAD